MASENLLELDIVANDLSSSGFASAKANASSYFSSVETEARRAAASLDALERRAALAGTGGQERLNLQRSFSLSDLRLAQDQVVNLTEAWDRLSSAEKHAVDIASLADITPRAAEGATTREEQIRRDLLAFDQFRAAQRQANIESSQRDVSALQRGTRPFLQTPGEVVAAERSRFFQNFTGTDAQRAEAEAAFAVRANRATLEEIALKAEASRVGRQKGEADFASALKSQQGLDSYIKSLEKEAALYGLKGADRKRAELAQLLDQYRGHPAVIDALTASYGKMIKVAEAADNAIGGHGGGTKAAVLGLKDLAEGNTRYAEIEGANFLRSLSGAPLGVGIFTAALLGLGIAAVESFKHLAELGVSIEDVHLKTGLTTREVTQFSFAAKAVGQDVGIFDRLMRGLTQASEENVASGKRGRAELGLLGVALRDDTGALRPTSQIVLELADAFNKLPPGLERNAAAMEIAKRGGAELIPVLQNLRSYTELAGNLNLGFDEHEIQQMLQYKLLLTQIEFAWQQLIVRVASPLAAVIKVYIDKSKEFQDFEQRYLNYFDDTARPTTPEGSEDQRLKTRTGLVGAARVQRQVQDEQVRAYLAANPPDQEEVLKQARTRFQKASTKPVFEQSPEEFEEYKAARADLRNREEAAKEHNRGLQDIIAAKQEGFKLEAQIAQEDLAGQERRLNARIDATKGFVSQSDILDLYQLADKEVLAKQRERIESKRHFVDPKTGRDIDQTGTRNFELYVAAEQANLPLLEREAYNRINTGRLGAADERAAKEQADRFMAPFEKQRLERSKIEQELFTNSEKMDREYVERKFTIESQSAEREKTLALDQLGFIDAQTIQQKLALEDQKLAIELRYSERSLDIQTRKLESERRREIDTKTGELNRAGIPDDDAARLEAIRQINEKYNLQETDLRTATEDKEVDAAQKVANEKTKLGIQQNERIFDSLKRSAEGVFDALLTKSKSFSDVMKDLFKTAILTPIKDILSSQTAALFTELLTGQKVTFAPLGNGQGPLGELGNVLGRLGLGQRIIGNQAVHGINLPGHLGEVTHINGAVPVFAVNLAAGTSIGARAITPGILQAHALSTPFRGIPSLAEGGLDLSNLLPQTPYEKVNSSVSYPSIYDTSSRSGPRNPQDPSLLSTHGFLTLGQQLASASSDLSGIFAGGSNAYSDQYSSPTGSTYGAAKVLNDLVTAIPGAPAYTGRYVEPVSTPEIGGILSQVLGGGSTSSGAGGGGFLGTILGAGGVSNAYEKQTSDQIGALLRGDTSGVSDDDRRILRQVLESRPSWERPSPEILDKIYPSGSGGGDGQSGGTGGVGGILGQIFGGKGKSGGIGGILSNLKGNFYSPNDIILGPGRATTVGGIVQSLGGGILGKAVGGLAGFANSPGAAALGLYAAYDGIRRGGIAGTLEAAAGGAEIGFKVGGPIGALAGAAIGGAIATTKSLFFESDRDHTKKLVKQIYGFDINDSTADAIIQIAKQKYGGAISIAARSQEVRDLLKLYAESIGNKGAKDQFVADTVHSASLVESRGQLYQNAIYDNGEAYSYAGPLGVLGGISSTKLPTAARDSGGFYGNLSINLNGQSALGALAGQVVRVSTPSFIQSQSVSGSRASIGRNSQAALNFAPSAISR